MILQEDLTTTPQTDVRVHQGSELARHLPRLELYLSRQKPLPLSWHPAWMTVLEQGSKHVPYCLEACEGTQTRGFLALAFVRSLLFGRFLVSLPYVNYGGVVADDAATARLLIDRARDLADRLDVRYLELRHVQPYDHPALNQTRSDKVHMRLRLPTSSEALWEQLSTKVRNQVRKAQKNDLVAAWGGMELLPEFYAIFSHNMRDLGSPVFSADLFRAILKHFPERAEICLVRRQNRALAAALLLHGWGITEVPSASSLRQYNGTCANMLMYWLLLERAVERGQGAFDFGRSSQDSNTFRFKKQWGAEPVLAQWQYYVRRGNVAQMRHDNPRYQRMISIWRRLPVPLTRWIGPTIVRGIP
jgi:FemAB-related protein (PEP-CTERM system-associated)